MVSNLEREATEVRNAEGLAGPAFSPMKNPKKAYTRDGYIKVFKVLKDVRGDYEQYQKNEDGKGYEALQKLGGRIHKDALRYFDGTRFPTREHIDMDIRPRIDAVSESIDWHLYHNRRSLVSVIEDDERKKPKKERKFFKEVALKTKGFLTAEDGTTEHDFLTRTINEYNVLNELASSEDPRAYSSIVAIVSKEMEKKDPVGAASGSLALDLRDRNYVLGKFNKILTAEKKVIDKILTPDRARDYVLKNMELAEEVYKQETYSGGDQDDLKKLVWKPILDEIAPRLYKIAKAEADKEKDKNDQDKHKDNIRAAKRRARGFPL